MPLSASDLLLLGQYDTPTISNVIELFEVRPRREGFMDVFHYGEGRERRLGYRLIDDAERYEDYPEVLQPTLIFHGAHDDVIPPQSSQAFAAGRSNVRLEILESGHDLLNMLDYMAPRIAAFLLPAAITWAG